MTTDTQQDAFFLAIHALQQQVLAAGHRKPVGHGHDGASEALRFKAAAHLGVASPLLEVSTEANGPCVVTCALFGLTGPAGVLPLHYRERVLELSRNKDTALRDFLDLFNHRLLSMLYRSWRKYRLPLHFAAGLQGGHEPVEAMLRALGGARLAVAPWFTAIFHHRVRTPEGLRLLLGSLLASRVTIREWQGRFLPLAEDEQTRLCGRAMVQGQHARLGGALLGRRSWNCAWGLTIVVEVERREQWLALQRGGRLQRELVEVSGRYLGAVMRYRIEIRLRRSLTTPARLLPCSGPTDGEGLGLGVLLTASKVAKPDAMVIFHFGPRIQDRIRQGRNHDHERIEIADRQTQPAVAPAT